MQEMSIGEFARRSRLSPRALRLYDGLGLLSPVRVNELSGYRYYERGQLEQAGLIAMLRHAGVPLATVREWLALDPAELAERVTAFWREAESQHAAQHRLVSLLVDRLTGKATVMYEVATREIDPEQLSLNPADPGVRITYLAGGPASESVGPDCDFAVPFA